MGNKILYCSRCNRKLGEYDGRSETAKSIQCRHCNRLITFKNGKFVKDSVVPKRTTASGMTFR